jgi:hypothetical protein
MEEDKRVDEIDRSPAILCNKSIHAARAYSGDDEFYA